MSEHQPPLPILGPLPGQPTSQKGRPLHVLTLTPFYPSDNDDASGCFIAEPLESLAACGITSTVFAVQPFYRPQLRARTSSHTTQWLRYFSLPGGIGLPTAGAFVFARIISEIRQLHALRRIDLVHAHAPLPCGHAAMLIKADLGIPYVVSVHGLDAFSTRQVQGRAGEWCRRISQRVYRSSQRVICISEHVRKQVLQGTGPNCRTSVVYNAVNPDMFSPSESASEGAPSLLSVGNLIPTKGHDVLLRAGATLRSEFPALTIDIIGEGAERGRLENLDRDLQLSDCVHFLGRRSRQQVAEAMRQCTIFVLPSSYEGLGCVYLEAMSVGKPVIGCRGQGVAEVIQHGSNGFLVGPNNDRELALAIGMLLRDRRRRSALGVAARDTILDKFTLAQQAQNLARIYRECAA